MTIISPIAFFMGKDIMKLQSNRKEEKAKLLTSKKTSNRFTKIYYSLSRGTTFFTCQYDLNYGWFFPGYAL